MNGDLRLCMVEMAKDSPFDARVQKPPSLPPHSTSNHVRVDAQQRLLTAEIRLGNQLGTFRLPSALSLTKRISFRFGSIDQPLILGSMSCQWQ